MTRQTIYLLLGSLLVVGYFMPGVAWAQSSDLAVDFETTPLFANTDVKPGDSEAKTITVTNNGGATEDVYISVDDLVVPGGGANLADVMDITISSGGTTYYTGSFTDFFGDVPVDLGDLAGGASRTYVVSASIDSSVGNAYQLKSFGFDLVLGFRGGDSTSDDDDDDDDDNGGGSGGGGGGATSFRLFNEALVGTTTDSGTISWDTNRPGTTFLVCGNVVDGPFTLDPNDSQLGYPLAVGEFDNDTRNHEAALDNLLIGTYECVPASRPNTSTGFTTGDPITFTLGTGGDVAGIATDGLGGDSPFVPAFAPSPQPLVQADTDKGGPAESPATTASPTPPSQIAGATTSTGSIDRLREDVRDIIAANCTLTWLLLLLLFTVAWTLIDDLGRNTVTKWRRRLFENLGFGLVYFLVVIGFDAAGLLASWWWVPVAAWTGFTLFDYRQHRLDDYWRARPRHAFYLILAILLVVAHFFLGWPCVWLPFALIGLATILLWVLRI